MGSARPKLPANVVYCPSHKAGLEMRYGVKVKIFGKQVRLGSRFADVESAQHVSQAFTAMVVKDRERLTLTLDEQSWKLVALGWYPTTTVVPNKVTIRELSCRVFATKTNKVSEELVLAYLQRWVSDRSDALTGRFVEARSMRRAMLILDDLVLAQDKNILR